MLGDTFQRWKDLILLWKGEAVREPISTVDHVGLHLTKMHKCAMGSKITQLQGYRTAQPVEDLRRILIAEVGGHKEHKTFLTVRRRWHLGCQLPIPDNWTEVEERRWETGRNARHGWFIFDLRSCSVIQNVSSQYRCSENIYMKTILGKTANIRGRLPNVL